MELTNLTHRLIYNGTTTTIQEPVGFDNLQVKIKRNDYHGMSVAYSDATLEFADSAARTVIDTAYAANIDSIVTYEVRNGSNAVIYSGQLDLSTYSKKTGLYTSISCKVAEIDARTTFNNRTGTEVDLNSSKTIDGVNSSFTPTWRNLHIPMKHLRYTNSVTLKNDEQINTAGGDDQPVGKIYVRMAENKRFFFFPMEGSVINEFGEISSNSAYVTGQDLSIVPNQYSPDSEHITKYGVTVVDIDMSISASARYEDAHIPGSDYFTAYCRLCATDGTNTITGQNVSINEANWISGRWTMDLKLTGSLVASNYIRYYMEFSCSNMQRSGYGFTIKISKGSYFKMTMYDNLVEVTNNTKMACVHDVLNIISHATSENALSVKSDWYGSELSTLNAPAGGAIGGGAYKMLTNGYKIRGLFTSGSNVRSMTLSFKDAIESLSAIDCIGWGFSNEDGTNYVRVEPWGWFYKNSLVLTLTNVAEVTTNIDTDRIVTSINIGYKKYATSDEYNSIDSLHGERNFASKIKAVSNDIEKLSDFIADNYAIEETRRAREDVDESEEFKYDENIFVFEIAKNGSDPYAISTSAYDTGGIIRPNEFINCKLTPRRNAERWRNFLFSCNHTENMRFISGTIYYGAHYKAIVGTSTIKGLLDPFGGADAYENADIAYSHAKFDAETIEFEYPLSTSQYNAIGANPYGLVSVNGTQGWILEFTYEIQTGKGKFKLLKKHV